jgi:hypothetical protein
MIELAGNFSAKLKSPAQLISEHRIMMMENWIAKQKAVDGLGDEVQVEEYLLKLMRARMALLSSSDVAGSSELEQVKNFWYGFFDFGWTPNQMFADRALRAAFGINTDMTFDYNVMRALVMLKGMWRSRFQE